LVRCRVALRYFLIDQIFFYFFLKLDQLLKQVKEQLNLSFKVFFIYVNFMSLKIFWLIFAVQDDYFKLMVRFVVHLFLVASWPWYVVCYRWWNEWHRLCSHKFYNRFIRLRIISSMHINFISYLFRIIITCEIWQFF